MVFRSCLGDNFFFGRTPRERIAFVEPFGQTPTWSETVIQWSFGAFRGWAGNRKMHFPSARGSFRGGKSGRPKSFSQNVRNFFTFFVLTDRTPRGGKSRNTGVLGHFGLGRPLALREIPDGKQKTTNSLIETEKREINPCQLGPDILIRVTELKYVVL